MSKGMLWGALGGASKAGMQVMDDRVKAQADERKRVQSIEDRRAYLIFEMEQKDKWARSQEEVEAKARERAAKGGVEIGNQRGATEMERGRGMLPSSGEFANDRITPEMIADLPPEARRIYEREMGLTPNTALQTSKDAMTAGQKQGAPGSVRKELTADYNNEVKTDNLRQKEAARDARDAAREAEREASQARVFAQQDKIQGKQHSATLAAIGARGSGGGGSGAKLRSTKTDSSGEVIAIMSDGSTKPLGIQDQVFAKNVATLMVKMQGDRKFSKLPEGELRELAANRLAGAQVDAAVDEPPAPKPVVPQSTKTDNGATKNRSITQAEFDALPKGASFVNPKDGKTYRKN
jgi:hypothetical protein